MFLSTAHLRIGILKLVVNRNLVQKVLWTDFSFLVHIPGISSPGNWGQWGSCIEMMLQLTTSSCCVLGYSLGALFMELSPTLTQSSLCRDSPLVPQLCTTTLQLLRCNTLPPENRGMFWKMTEKEQWDETK